MNQPKSIHGDDSPTEKNDPAEPSQLDMQDSGRESDNDAEYRLQPNDDEPVVAEYSNSTTALNNPNSRPGYADAIGLNPLRSKHHEVDLAVEFRNISAIGGAVGGFAFGLWSIVCSMITYFGFINAVLAIALGIYGLRSPRKRLAMIGIVLGVVGLLMSLMEFNEVLNKLLTIEESFES